MYIIHGKTNTKVYNTYKHIKNRCTKKYEFSKDYYKRGIKNLWKSFNDFYKDMGDPPTAQHSIDRIDNNGNYCKENCRWATKKEQVNNRRNNILITYKNKTMTLMQWSEEKKIEWHTLWYRLKKRNWSIEKTLETKPRIKI